MTRVFQASLLSVVSTLLAILTSCTVAPTSVTTVEPRISFEGTVTRGQDFVKELPSGLTFRLEYYSGDGEGWFIWVGNKAQPDENFDQYVTPPFRGLNDLSIEGWHFRNAANTNPRTSSDPYTPQATRRFQFVLNESDYQIASDTLQKVLWPYRYSKDEVEQAWQIYDQLPTASGTLTITEMKLGNLVRGERANIESMNFEVSFSLLPTNGK